MATIPTILRGEDTAARGRTLAINLPEGDYTGLTIRLQWCGLERSWESPASGASLQFGLSAAETAALPLGTHMGRLGVVLADGTGYIISEAIRIRVTDDVAEAMGVDNAIQIAPADAARTLELDLDGIEDEPGTPDALRAAWREFLRRLRASLAVSLVFLCLAGTARAEGRLVAQTAASGSLPWGAPVVTNVTVEGELGLGAEAVTNIAEAVAASRPSISTNDVRAIVSDAGYLHTASPDGHSFVDWTENDSGEWHLAIDYLDSLFVNVLFGFDFLGGGLYSDSGTIFYGDWEKTYDTNYELAVKGDLAAVDIRTNLPPLTASSTVGDLVDAYNAIANALKKENE